MRFKGFRAVGLRVLGLKGFRVVELRVLGLRGFRVLGSTPQWEHTRCDDATERDCLTSDVKWRSERKPNMQVWLFARKLMLQPTMQVWLFARLGIWGVLPS